MSMMPLNMHVNQKHDDDDNDDDDDVLRLKPGMLSNSFLATANVMTVEVN